MSLMDDMDVCPYPQACNTADEGDHPHTWHIHGRICILGEYKTYHYNLHIMDGMNQWG